MFRTQVRDSKSNLQSALGRKLKFVTEPIFLIIRYRDSHIVQDLRVLDVCDQAIKGVWRMSRHQKALKGVEGCDKPRGVVKQTMIRGFLN